MDESACRRPPPPSEADLSILGRSWGRPRLVSGEYFDAFALLPEGLGGCMGVAWRQLTNLGISNQRCTDSLCFRGLVSKMKIKDQRSGGDTGEIRGLGLSGGCLRGCLGGCLRGCFLGPSGG